jgi:hypothetical protein
MAKAIATNPGRMHWHTPSPHFWHVLSLTALWLVIISLGIFLFASIVMSVITTLAHTPYFQGGGGMSEAMPLSFLAAFMTFTWLPFFMPFLIPVAMLALLLAWPFSDGAKQQYAKVWSGVERLN